MIGLPTRVVSTTAGENILRDVDFEIRFADYQRREGGGEFVLRNPPYQGVRQKR